MSILETLKLIFVLDREGRTYLGLKMMSYSYLLEGYVCSELKSVVRFNQTPLYDNFAKPSGS